MIAKNKDLTDLMHSFCHVRKQKVDHLSNRKQTLTRHQTSHAFILDFLTSRLLGKIRPLISYLNYGILFIGIQTYNNIKGRVN
jgi:hypothetical protein